MIVLYKGDCLIEMNKIDDKSVDMICKKIQFRIEIISERE